ncbi:ABC transporter permease [Roseomonas sp. CCTCC AB2023176]|uniref:ABC transporter permease n=1 Tax=Roseomonas sp. CCTCC AB2023176 TaxID=3342640 RepID=UPI0035DA8161
MRRAGLLTAEAGVFLLALWAAPRLEPLWHALFPEVARPAYVAEPWFVLLGNHLALACGAMGVAAVLGIGAGIAAARRPEARSALDGVFALAQAVPPVAVIALSLPVLGFGAAPTLLALALYAALPMLRATAAGLAAIPPDVAEAARGLGMGPWRRLQEVELPLAAPVILSGLRVAAALSVATAAIGAVAGARCLGSPIILGLANGNPAYVLQGALFTAWLALLVDRALGLIGAGREAGA